MKKVFNWVLILVMAISLLLTGCSKGAAPQAQSPASNDKSNFETVLQNAKGTTVNFYAWGGDERTNKWVETVWAKKVKDLYDITLKLNRVDDIQTTIAKIANEKQVNSEKGTADLLWINGENFYTAKKNDLLYGPFTQYLPSYQKYIDQNSSDVKFDFGYEVNGYEAPYGKAGFVFINDSALTPETPKNAQELLEFAKKYPGKVTYSAPPDFTGSVFVRQIIYDIVGYDKVNSAGADKAKIKEAIQPALAYLKELKPYLWKEGKTYPAALGQLDNMFADGEVVFNMSYNPNAVAGMISQGTYKDTARDFVFEKGMIGNTHFLAIPYNAPNKDGALAVINAILTPELQTSKYDAANWGDLPVVDETKLDSSEKALFDKIPLGKGVMPLTELMKNRLPELPAAVVPIIEEIWQEEIPSK
jgi:putative spermidine/putrescine transport system substrate-binding protein